MCVCVCVCVFFCERFAITLKASSLFLGLFMLPQPVAMHTGNVLLHIYVCKYIYLTVCDRTKYVMLIASGKHE